MTAGEVLLDGISNPYRFQVDEKNGYLFVAENELSSTGLAVSGKINVYTFDSPKPPQWEKLWVANISYQWLQVPSGSVKLFIRGC